MNMSLKSHGITEKTPENLLFSAGAIYKNLSPYKALKTEPTDWSTKYTSYYERIGTAGNYTYTLIESGEQAPTFSADKYYVQEWDGTVLGATNGGITLSITPEYVNAELDGASVSVKGAKIKVAETATMESNMTEFSEGIIKESLHLQEDTSGSVEGYKKYISKRSITDDDYLENIAYVGTLVSGKQIIVILPNAICTSALELQGQNKTQATYTITFECTASFEQEDLEHLPYEIYYPQEKDTQNI